jgi:Tfp pilus assembly protein PilP
MVRSPIGIVGLLLVLSGCANQNAEQNGVIAPSPSITSAAAQEQPVSQPFQELLTQAATAPPRLIPELASAQSNLPETANSSKLPSIPLPSVPLVEVDAPLTDAPLSVPVPPAPAIVQTVPIPNPNPPVRVASRPAASATSPQPSSRQTSVATRSPSTTARSPVPQSVPQTVARPAQPQTAQPQTAAPQSPSSVARSLAESVQVTGIVHAGDTVSAIVQMPNEHSRYVRAGDYLANGSILVSRIEITSNDEARVVLVQNGVQTVKTVGN